MQSSSQIITTNKPTSGFLQAGCPSCRPTNSVKALRGENITFHGFAYPKLTGGLPTLSLTTNSSWLPWGGLPCLSSALRCQYPNPMHQTTYLNLNLYKTRMALSTAYTAAKATDVAKVLLLYKNYKHIYSFPR